MHNWIDCAFDVDGEHVRVAVRRLDADERRMMAAEIGWFAESLLAPSPAPRPSGWSELLERILTSDVAITVDDAMYGKSDQSWDELVCRAFEAFVCANGLDGPIRQYLRSAPDRRAS